jgi:tetratricopeptide (TPR) repeat protein
MFKIILLFILISGCSAMAYAQTAEEVYNRYVDFSEARLNADKERSMSLAEKILPDTAKLKPNTRVSFFNFLAQLYEEDSQSINAIKYYKIVAASQPDYYVAHRALGYLYIKDITGKQTLVNAAYITKAKAALPHLEKAEACDHDDTTLAIIKMLYRNLKDDKALTTLPQRLEALKKNCVDLLSDQ